METNLICNPDFQRETQAHILIDVRVAEIQADKMQIMSHQSILGVIMRRKKSNSGERPATALRSGPSKAKQSYKGVESLHPGRVSNRFKEERLSPSLDLKASFCDDNPPS